MSRADLLLTDFGGGSDPSSPLLKNDSTMIQRVNDNSLKLERILPVHKD